MKPKLIILNGPLGIGKSTLAKRYGVDHPLTLELDIDDVWSMISHWREEKETSAPLSKSMALAMARVNLQAGNDVIVPQILQTAELLLMFQDLATECSADYYEILLYVEKDEAVRRFINRSKKAGHPTGFREGGIIATTGREQKLEEMYDKMMTLASSKPEVITIEPVFEDVEGTYQAMLEAIRAA